MFTIYKNVILGAVVALGSGCFMCSDYLSDPGGVAPVDIVPTHKPVQVYSADNAVNRMITSLSIKCIVLFGGRAPIVKKDFVSDDDVFNSLPERVYHSLSRAGDIKPPLKGIVLDGELVLKSNIKLLPKRTVWLLQLVDDGGVVRWEQELLLKMEI